MIIAVTYCSHNKQVLECIPVSGNKISQCIEEMSFSMKSLKADDLSERNGKTCSPRSHGLRSKKL